MTNKRRYISAVFLFFFLLCSIYKCIHSMINLTVPLNYTAVCTVYEQSDSDSSTAYDEYFIYPDKSYICVSYRQDSDGEWEKAIQKPIKIGGWNDLQLIISGYVCMNEGDVARLSVKQYIQYMKDLYP